MQLIRNPLIRPNSMRFVNFLTHNFILVKTNVKSTYKRHMDDAQDVNCMTFVHDFYVRCLRAYWSNHIVLPEVVFRYACFLVSSFRCFEKRTLVYDEFHKILLKIVSLHVKLEVKHSKLHKRKVPQTSSGSFAQKWLFCKTHALNNICSIICSQNSRKTTWN